MILIGQYDSPFVRRVGIALTLYGIPFEHKPWSTFGDADKIRPYNPLTRVPTLVLDDGDVLIDSTPILDYLDSLVPAEKRMLPAAEPARHRALKVTTMGVHTAEKAVSLFYERALHKDTASDVWVNRCRTQISGALAALEPDRAARKTDYWFGDAIGHADIAVAVALRFIARRASGRHRRWRTFRRSTRTAKRCEALPVFQTISRSSSRRRDRQCPRSVDQLRSAVPRLHDHLARDLSAFQVDHRRAEYFRSVGIRAALREGEAVSDRHAGFDLVRHVASADILKIRGDGSFALQAVWLARRIVAIDHLKNGIVGIHACKRGALASLDRALERRNGDRL